MPRSADIEAALEEIRCSTDPQEIRQLVESAPVEAWHFRPAPGEWSIVEILRHLGDTEEMRHMRFDRMLAEDNPYLTRPIPGPGERDTDDARALCARWERLRARAYARLNGMTEAEWRRVGTQGPDPQVRRTADAPTDVLQQAGRINEHSGDHLQQMRRNLAAYHAQTCEG